MKVEALIDTFWAGLDGERIVKKIFPLRGGWEGWAQVELAATLAEQLDPDVYHVYREDRSLYKIVGAAKGLRADLVVEQKRTAGTKTGFVQHLFELKCERSDQGFSKAELAKDVQKWESLRSPIQPGVTSIASVAQIFIGASIDGLKVLSGAVEDVLEKKAAKVFTVERDFDNGLWLRARTWPFGNVVSAGNPIERWA